MFFSLLTTTRHTVFNKFINTPYFFNDFNNKHVIIIIILHEITIFNHSVPFIPQISRGGGGAGARVGTPQEAPCGGLPSVTDRANHVNDLTVRSKRVAPVSQHVRRVGLEVHQQMRVGSRRRVRVGVHQVLGSLRLQLPGKVSKLTLVSGIAKQHHVLRVEVDVAHDLALAVQVLQNQHDADVLVVAFLRERLSNHLAVGALGDHVVKHHELWTRGRLQVRVQRGRHAGNERHVRAVSVSFLPFGVEPKHLLKLHVCRTQHLLGKDGLAAARRPDHYHAEGVFETCVEFDFHG